MDTKDVIIRELVRKKKSLLDELLALSIRSVYENSQETSALRQRSTLLHMLQINDNAIQTREQQTGIMAMQQEQELFSDISSLLSSIKDNNNQALMRLEGIEKDYEKEKSTLAREKKLAYYVMQTKKPTSQRKKTDKGLSHKTQTRKTM